jgi:hypothetical protein
MPPMSAYALIYAQTYAIVNRRERTLGKFNARSIEQRPAIVQELVRRPAPGPNSNEAKLVADPLGLWRHTERVRL